MTRIDHISGKERDTKTDRPAPAQSTIQTASKLVTVGAGRHCA